VRIAKADLVPTDTNLLEAYHSFGDLEAACREFCEQVNDRPHRETRRRPIEALAEERTRLHPLTRKPFTVAFGTTRRVNWDGTVSVEGVRYSVPHPLVDTRVWVRFHGDDLVITAVADTGPGEGRPSRPLESGHALDPAGALPATHRRRGGGRGTHPAGG
jgi:hypothetical protein